MFIHESANLESAMELVVDAKLQSPTTCNAIETLLVQKSIAPAFFERFRSVNSEMNMKILACPRTKKFLKNSEAASAMDFRREFGDDRLAVKILDSLDLAIDHINTHGSHHTDVIVAQDAVACATFFDRVDSATVLANASSRFADGYRMGLGAEVGVSTSKIHVRGPAGLDSLVTTKFIVRGEGQVVSDYIGRNAKPFKHRIL
jgi:glutamate-5-semialdehyde dehydrogenase